METNMVKNKKVIWFALFLTQPLLIVGYHLFTMHYPLLRELFPDDLRELYAQPLGAIDALWCIGSAVSIILLYLLLLLSFLLSKYWNFFKALNWIITAGFCLYLIYAVIAYNNEHPIFTILDMLFKTVPFLWCNYFLLKRIRYKSQPRVTRDNTMPHPTN